MVLALWFSTSCFDKKRAKSFHCYDCSVAFVDHLIGYDRPKMASAHFYNGFVSFATCALF